MRIALYSDIHREFNNPFKPNLKGIDVLVIAGDTDNRADRLTSWLKSLIEEEPRIHIVFVTGNHEYYGRDLNIEDQNIREKLADEPHIHFLQNSSVVLDGIRFIGATLWTNYNDRDIHAMDIAQLKMNDFRQIRTNEYTSRICPKIIYYKHMDSANYIFNTLRTSNEPCVVVTHHKPFTTKNLHWKYQDQHPLLKYCYESDLTAQFNALPDNKAPKYWLYGHNHNVENNIRTYKSGKVKFMCNCVGYYGYEDTQYKQRRFNA